MRQDYETAMPERLRTTYPEGKGPEQPLDRQDRQTLGQVIGAADGTVTRLADIRTRLARLADMLAPQPEPAQTNGKPGGEPRPAGIVAELTLLGQQQHGICRQIEILLERLEATLPI